MTSHDADARSTLAAQESQHATVRGLIAATRAASTASDLRPLLTRMSSLMADHFAHEEAEDGVFAFVLETNPMAGHAIDRFVAEHRDFLARASAASAALDSDPSGVVKAAHALCDDLAAHEELENEVLLQTHNEDIGGRG
jgi:iron-sulfur cluster repair protein YtfE (RIC family)